jgi:hypothetical protein
MPNIDIRDHIRELNARCAAIPRRTVPRPPPTPAGLTALDPVSVQIAALNARAAAQQPRPRPAPAPAGLTSLDQAAAARCPALQHAQASNRRDMTAREARAAALEKQRRERLEQQAITVVAVEEARAVRAAKRAHARQIKRALSAMAEAFIKKHPEV